MKSIATCLMFVGDQHGKTEEAISLYTSVFKNSRIIDIERWAADEGEPEGTVKVARFSLNGVEFMATENSGEHGFTFTPSISLYVECESSQEIQLAYDALLDGGKALMPLDNYGFSFQFGWVEDRFGVSWQLNLSE